MKIEKLLNEPESKTLEYKRDLSSLVPILKTIIAFANTAGGILIIGRAPEGEIIGIEDIFKSEEKLANSIADNIYPQMLPEIEITTINGKDLLVVKVSHWKAPFYLKKEGFPNGVYIRLGSTSRPAGPELLNELQRSVLSPSFDQQPLSDLTKEALDIEQINLFFRKANRKINEQKLRSLDVLVLAANRIVPSIGGLILFGKSAYRKSFVPEARISCARFHGSSKANILDRYDIDGTILEAIDEVLKFIARNTRLTSQIKEIQRQDIPEYSPLAIREGLINALVHADYSLGGSHIQIAIYDDRLEIQNPGMFPFGFTLEDFKAGVSKIRNRVIARVFYELQFMEGWGSGYKRIVEECEKNNYPQPKWEELGTTIRVIFYPYSPSFLRTEQKEPKLELMQREEVILALFEKNKNLPFRKIKHKFPKISERTLRYDLAQLKKKGLLKTKGKGRAIIWEKVEK